MRSSNLEKRDSLLQAQFVQDLRASSEANATSDDAELCRLELEGFVASRGPGSASPAVSLIDVNGASLRNCRAVKGTKTFLMLDGSYTADISAVGNDLRQAEHAFELTGAVPDGAIGQYANLLPLAQTD